jgi:hypothetical protein
VFLAVTWVVTSPWLPRRPGARALATIPIAIALGTGALIDARNPDFLVLRRDPLVVATLVILIAALGPAMTVVDAWLDRVLPRPTVGASGAAMGYASFAAIGALIGMVLTVQALLDPRARAFGLTVLLTGAMTIVWWLRRLRGHPDPGPALQRAAGAFIAIGTLVGLAAVIPDIRGALTGA